MCIWNVDLDVKYNKQGEVNQGYIMGGVPSEEKLADVVEVAMRDFDIEVIF